MLAVQDVEAAEAEFGNDNIDSGFVEELESQTVGHKQSQVFAKHATLSTLWTICKYSTVARILIATCRY